MKPTRLLCCSSYPKLRLSYVEDFSPTPTLQARMAFLNTLDTVPTIEVHTSAGPIEGVPNLNFGQAPVAITLSAVSYNFYTSEVRLDGMNQAVEYAENVQLEAGRSYLYLITGRMDSNPIILSDRVGTDATLAEHAEGEFFLENAAYIRFINAAVESPPLDLWLNGAVVSPQHAFMQVTDLISIEQTTLDIGISTAGSSDLLAETFAVLESGGYYTIVVYGENTDELQFTVMPDSNLIFERQSPRLRLINVSSDSSAQLGLGYAPADAQRIEPFGEEEIRRTIPLGITRLVNGIDSGGYSTVILVSAGSHDIAILDSANAQLAHTLPDVLLEGGAHYDVFAYMESESLRVNAFIVPYPAR